MAKQFGFMQVQDGATDVNAVDFAIRQILKKSTMVSKIVRVMAVDASAKTVDVQPMVDQVTPEGQAIPHGTINSVPYGYIQGGACRIKLDPVDGDIGVVVFEDRDITRVKKTWKNATPSTLRAHSYADALYVGTLIAASSPKHIISFDQSNGISFTSSVPVKFNADVDITGKVTTSSTITAAGEITGNSIALSTHKHPVTAAPGTTGVPEA